MSYTPPSNDSTDFELTSYTALGNDSTDFQLGATPSAPSNLSVTQGSESQLDLTWTDNATTEDGFYVYRAQTTGSVKGDYTQVADLTVDAESHTDTALEDGEKFFYRVSAYNTSGESDFSNEDSAITVLPAAQNTFGTIPIDIVPNSGVGEIRFTSQEHTDTGQIEIGFVSNGEQITDTTQIGFSL